MVQSGVVSGLVAAGCRVLDIGIIPTPTIALMVSKVGADGGVMVTASHNPREWNGIKFITGAGHAPFKEEAEVIVQRIRERSESLANVDDLLPAAYDGSAVETHVARVLEVVGNEPFGAGMKVVADSVHGAGGHGAGMLLRALGCRVTPLYSEPTGQFPRSPEPVAENLQELCAVTKAVGAAVGFAQDPDADRLALVDENGRYVGEEYTFALCAKHVLSKTPGPVVANLSTSRMIDDIAQSLGGECVVHRSAVGEANVVEVMKQTNAVVGGEGNGGAIDPRVVYVRDSFSSMAHVLQMMSERGKKLSELVDELPRYEMVKEKFECESDRIARVLEAVKSAFASENCNDLDGVRIDWPTGWAHVRGSNTEPIMRVMGESSDRETALQLIKKVRTVVDSVR
jgi:phosphomannomutase